MKPVRVMLGALVATALTGAVVALSQVPWEADASDQARLRLAWRYRGGLVSACRTRTPEELARLPQHMRREQDCERRLRPYLLEVTRDGVIIARDTVAARGARSDRPLSVYREIHLAPGPRALRVTFLPLHADSLAPAGFTLDTAVTLAPRQILLVTLDDAATHFITTSR